MQKKYQAQQQMLSKTHTSNMPHSMSLHLLSMNTRQPNLGVHSEHSRYLKERRLRLRNAKLRLSHIKMVSFLSPVQQRVLNISVRWIVLMLANSTLLRLPSLPATISRFMLQRLAMKTLMLPLPNSIGSHHLALSMLTASTPSLCVVSPSRLLVASSTSPVLTTMRRWASTLSMVGASVQQQLSAVSSPSPLRLTPSSWRR